MLHMYLTNLQTVILHSSSLLPQTITVLFSFTNRSASPSPIPEAPPVINILLFEIFIDEVVLYPY